MMTSRREVRDGHEFCNFQDTQECLSLLVNATDLSEMIPYITENHITKLVVEMSPWAIPSVKTSLAPLYDCVGLECLSLPEKCESLSALYHLHQLRWLAINNENMEETLDVRCLPSLKYLSVYKWRKNIQGIPHAAKLETLKVWNYAEKDRTLQQLGNLHYLKALHLIRPNTKSLSGIETCRRLEQIEVSYARSLTDITALAQCASLKTVEFESCPNLLDFEPLTQKGFISCLTGKKVKRFERAFHF